MFKKDCHRINKNIYNYHITVSHSKAVLPVQDGGSSDLSGQSYLPSQYSSNRTHLPVDLHINSDMRQHRAGPMVQQLSTTAKLAIKESVLVTIVAAGRGC